MQFVQQCAATSLACCNCTAPVKVREYHILHTQRKLSLLVEYTNKVALKNPCGTRHVTQICWDGAVQLQYITTRECIKAQIRIKPQTIKKEHKVKRLRLTQYIKFRISQWYKWLQNYRPQVFIKTATANGVPRKVAFTSLSSLHTALITILNCRNKGSLCFFLMPHTLFLLFRGGKAGDNK